MLSVEWLPRARLDMSSIAIYIGVEQHAPKVAKDILLRVEETVKLIAEFPELGRQVEFDGLQRSGYRRAIAGTYHVYYRYSGQALTVCRILHERQNIDRYTLLHVNPADIPAPEPGDAEDEEEASE